jgi:ABC-type branched-subunit amino acid transport system substrate-binding protein
VNVESAADPGALARRLAGEGAVAVVAALPDRAQDAFEEAAMAEGLVVLDARPAHPDAAPERDGVFRVGVPDSVYSSGAGTGSRLVLWHPGLFRYGAEQLNERYRRRFDAGMTAEAWAGWMAVKAVTEATLRAKGESVPKAGLADSRAGFDGHKGGPLAFSGPGRALAQPLYALEGGETREVPWPEENTR